MVERGRGPPGSCRRCRRRRARGIGAPIRIVTWNCCRGPLGEKLAAAERLRPDLLVLQEATKPASAHRSQLWFGSNPRQGVFVAGYRGLELAAAPTQGSSAFAVKGTGTACFSLLAAWAQPRPSYAAAMQAELVLHRAFLTPPSVVAGDFNTSSTLDGPSGRATHATLVRMLEQEFGLVSAYHAYTGELHGAERVPTHYWRWQEASSFHIDYCFVPRSWRIERVEVGGFADWKNLSDHRPLIVDLEPRSMAASHDR